MIFKLPQNQSCFSLYTNKTNRLNQYQHSHVDVHQLKNGSFKTLQFEYQRLILKKY